MGFIDCDDAIESINEHIQDLNMLLNSYNNLLNCLKDLRKNPNNSESGTQTKLNKAGFNNQQIVDFMTVIIKDIKEE